MARGLISIKSTGLKEFIAELNGLAEQLPEISKQALQSRQKVVEDKIRANWSSMVGGSSSGYVASSIGQSSAFSKSNPNDIVGTVGVYKIDSVSSSFGKSESDLNAAQIAYWVEFGTSRLRSGNRKVKGLEYSEEDLINIGAKPFISNAFYSTLDEQENAFKVTFNKLADNLKR
tara:strand:- start:70 stop:591 length:522 start_codon:yes stop_codon:yes gene_type:complete